ncbi:MAG: hypothetical protein KY397_00295 [Gemmatimonadetes bacterium]|nr:hypothetical protein [Gemmatimonadota bacterium]
MPKTWIAVVALGLVGFPRVPAIAQDVRPLSPAIGSSEVERETREKSLEEGVMPLPEASSRAATADAARARAAVLPTAWMEVAARWQPHWIGIGPAHAYGVDRWSSWFAAAGLVPRVEPHPFFSPWGLYAYDGWIFDRYRSAWTALRKDGRIAEAAGWIRRGDRAMLEGRELDAATAYRRATVAAPELPHGYLGLGAALAGMGEDAAAAQAWRQSVDRWPAWLPLDLGWSRLWGDEARLVTVLEASLRRAADGDPDSAFVAGALHLFGGRPTAGREFLGAFEADRHADVLLSRGPR